MIYARHIPNILTALRFIAIPCLCWLLMQGDYTGAATVFLIASLSDGLDGLLARRFGWSSRLGAILDPLADKGLIVISFVALTCLGLINPLLTSLVVLRDSLIILGVACILYQGRQMAFRPSGLSKLNTVLQMILVASLLIDLSGFHLSHKLLSSLVWMVALTTGLSFLDYLKKGLGFAAIPLTH